MEKQGLFPIGTVAKLFHISVGSLRHYEKLGLVQPEFIDQETGYRYYSTGQFECLNTIRYLRALDMPLPQIAAFLENRDVEQIQTLLLQQKEAVRRKQEALRIIERKIDNRLQQLADARTSKLDAPSLIQTKPRRIACLQRELSLHSVLDLEPVIRSLEAKQKDTAVFLGKVGVGISAQHLLQKAYGRYDMVFLCLDAEDSYNGKTLLLPAGTCAAIRFCGSHPEAPHYYARLLSFIEENRLCISGFSLEITMIDYGLTNDPDQFVTEIQIPVSAADPA